MQVRMLQGIGHALSAFIGIQFNEVDGKFHRHRQFSAAFGTTEKKGMRQTSGCNELLQTLADGILGYGSVHGQTFIVFCYYAI